jgi:methylglutamate dehydrogenase subunit B
MRIPCPFCGERDAQEFAYLGDATVERPDGDAPDALRAFHDYVYLRANPAGLLREYWQHVTGCRSWLVVTRDTRSHAVTSAELAGRKT